MQAKTLRLLATDLDGTLLLPRGLLGKHTRRIAERWQKEGRRILLASSRPHTAMREIHRVLALDTPLIAYNGSLIFDPLTEEILFEKGIPAETAREIITRLEQDYPSLQVSVETEHLVFAKEHYSWLDHAASLGYQVGGVGPLLPRIRKTVFKINLFQEGALPASFGDEMRHRFGASVAVTSPWEGVFELVAPQVSKAAALAWLLPHLNLSPTEILAAGDAANDCEMLQFAGWGLAMQNGAAETKTAANQVIGHHQEEALAFFLEQILDEPDRLLQNPSQAEVD